MALKDPKLALFRPSSQTLIPFPPYLATEICRALRAAHPAGDGSVAILEPVLACIAYGAEMARERFLEIPIEAKL